MGTDVSATEAAFNFIWVCLSLSLSLPLPILSQMCVCLSFSLLLDLSSSSSLFFLLFPLHPSLHSLLLPPPLPPSSPPQLFSPSSSCLWGPVSTPQQCWWRDIVPLMTYCIFSPVLCGVGATVILTKGKHCSHTQSFCFQLRAWPETPNFHPLSLAAPSSPGDVERERREINLEIRLRIPYLQATAGNFTINPG